MMNLSKTLVFFDLETTGPSVAKDRIVEISLKYCNPDGSFDLRTRRVNPTIPISPEATEVHGITNEDVANEPTFRKVAKSLKEFLTDCDLGGYNILRFDLPLLVEEFHRCGIQFPEPGTRFVDSMAIFHAKEKRDLTAAYKFYCNKDLEGAHEAEADTKATSEVFFAQVEKYNDIGDSIEDIEKFCLGGNEIIDFDRKIVRNSDGNLVFNFGKNKGEKVYENSRYVNWMLTSDFTQDTKSKLRDILEGKLK